jgi:hypothetical protein
LLWQSTHGGRTFYACQHFWRYLQHLAGSIDS